MQAAAPIVNEVCSDDTLLYNITEALSHSYTIFQVFLHYVNPQKLDLFMHTPRSQQQSMQREIVLDEFKNVCMIDKWLRDIPRSKPQPKSGKRAALSRWMRGVKQRPPRTHSRYLRVPPNGVVEVGDVKRRAGGRENRAIDDPDAAALRGKKGTKIYFNYELI